MSETEGLTPEQTKRVNERIAQTRAKPADPGRSLLNITDLSAERFEKILRTAAEMKRDPEAFRNILDGKKIALLFQKTSTRTKESFSTGAYELGMFSSYINWEQSNFTLAELEDEVRALSQWYDVIMARVYRHEDLLTMREHSEAPVINGLCDKAHPCQALTDLMTIREYFGDDLSNLKLAYVGDGNNVCNSLIRAAAMAGMGEVMVASPVDNKYAPLEEAEKFAASKVLYKRTGDPEEAVAGAHVVYTDTWISMGQESERKERLDTFGRFQVNEKLTALADANHIFMHDLPAHPGYEVTPEILRGPRSVVFEQAQNRKHAQKALLYDILGG